MSDAPTATLPKRGRPRKAKTGKTFTAYMPPTKIKKLDRVSKSKGQSRGEWIESALDSV